MTIAVITGGTRGIGKHLVKGFIQAGYSVVFTSTNSAKAAIQTRIFKNELSLQSGQGHRGPTIHGVMCDVADAKSVTALRRAVESVAQGLGETVGVVVNNAGVIEEPEGPVWDVPAAQIQRTIETNVLGPFFVVQEFAPMLLAQAEAKGVPGRFIDMNSGSGSQGSPEYAAYSASKVALFRLADSVQHFGFELGLRIFELAPGVVRSDMTTAMPVHSWRGEGDWTDPQDMVDLALGFASGDLDGFSGRFARAGHDTVESIRASIERGMDDDYRVMRMKL